MDAVPVLYRLVFAVMSESGGLQYASLGAAFPASAAEATRTWEGYPRGESPWTWEDGKPIPELDVTTEAGRARRAAIRAALSESTTFPHDAVGNNGLSTGILQQISQDAVAARYPGKTWGWGSLAQTMDIEKACRMFLDRVRVTNDRTYRSMVFDPIAADVLRVQQPLVSESSSANYSAARVAEAKRIVDQWGPAFFTGGAS